MHPCRAIDNTSQISAGDHAGSRNYLHLVWVLMSHKHLPATAAHVLAFQWKLKMRTHLSWKAFVVLHLWKVKELVQRMRERARERERESSKPSLYSNLQWMWMSDFLFSGDHHEPVWDCAVMSPLTQYTLFEQWHHHVPGNAMWGTANESETHHVSVCISNVSPAAVAANRMAGGPRVQRGGTVNCLFVHFPHCNVTKPFLLV